MEFCRTLGICTLTVCLIGCGGSDAKVGLVEGTVTLDGKPVHEAMITFEPLFTGGSPSYCAKKTDENGHYTMTHKLKVPGVLIGKHRVSISTYHKMVVRTIPEIIPVKYNDETELEREVVAGSQVIDFELTSD